MASDSLNGLLEGLIAGYGIAIPVGAISILIIDISLRHGFKLGFAAGAGAASVDFFFALLAASAGELVSGVIAPYQSSIQMLSGISLLLIGIWGLIRFSRRRHQDPKNVGPAGKPLKVYAQFVALTAINPLTIAYFTALILGREAGASLSVAAKVLFVVGVGFASFSWQALIAALGALASNRLDPRFQVFTAIFGNALIIILGVNILL